MLTFCTLFDSNYIDKGLTMFDSLANVCKDFRLYVLSMDDRCFEILSDLSYEHLIPIRLAEFENEDLLKVKPQRSRAEYCWTCSASLVKYIIKTYSPEYCTYIDSDLYFYDNPQCIIDEMIRRNASVQITGHRFYDDVAKEMSWEVGKYCVEYNTFKNDEKGNGLLDIWVNQCLEYCSTDGDGIHWADQKYMDNWVDDYPFVIETDNMGAGVAPWNIAKYKMEEHNGYNFSLNCEGKKCRLFFYHFQAIAYLDRRVVNMNVYGRKGVQRNLVEALYRPYLLHIEKNKQMLRDMFQLDIILRHHPGIKRRFVFWGKLKSIVKDIIFFRGKGNNIPDWRRRKLNVISF